MNDMEYLVDAVVKLKSLKVIKRDSEIATALNYSKGVISEYLNGKKKVSDDFLTSFKEYYGEHLSKKVINDSRVNDPGEAHILDKKSKTDKIEAINVDTGKQIGVLIQESIKITASLSVLEQMMDKVVADQTGKSIALVCGERQQATDMMALRLFEQWKKKLE